MSNTFSNKRKQMRFAQGSHGFHLQPGVETSRRAAVGRWVAGPHPPLGAPPAPLRQPTPPLSLTLLTPLCLVQVTPRMWAGSSQACPSAPPPAPPRCQFAAARNHELSLKEAAGDGVSDGLWPAASIPPALCSPHPSSQDHRGLLHPGCPRAAPHPHPPPPPPLTPTHPGARPRPRHWAPPTGARPPPTGARPREPRLQQRRARWDRGPQDACADPARWNREDQGGPWPAGAPHAALHLLVSVFTLRKTKWTFMSNRTSICFN